ncbi:transmembrane protein 94-like isoform X2 [Daphnia carinata]|uniref:transmembrane protein 94-like isoform X2 n=1 Tax=Daphnia carinata TaxID=120202 RepID=UPI00257B3353|nr:transmembrane protein 94-like isoform X2 [Daphnia carinata]
MDIRGLSTCDALQKLLEEMHDVIHNDKSQDARHSNSLSNNVYSCLTKAALQIREPLCTFNWISLAVLSAEVVAMIVAHEIHEYQKSQVLLWEAILLLLLTVFNFLFACWDTQLRKTEMRTRTEWLRNFVNEWKHKCEWIPENYPHIHSPQSPSITLQATIRDGNIVNLPWALLVKGDVIVLRPGQPAPGRCRNIAGKNEPNFTLEADEIYTPLTNSDKAGPFNTPLLRRPLPCTYCILEETPYVQSIRIALKESLNRPTGVLYKEKFLCFAVCLEQFIAPIFLVLLLVFNAGRYFYFSEYLSSGHWTDMFLIQPCLVVLPLLPLVLPVAWLIINVYGVALILALFYTARHFKISNDPFEDAEVTAPTHPSFWVKCKEMKPYFLDTLVGRGKSPFRTGNIFQTLSSVTALCCVDKKGILSWPNPTAEKVFFLRNGSWGHQQTDFGKEGTTLKPTSTVAGAILKKDKDSNKRTRKRSNKRACAEHARNGYETRAEVLDLSHDCTTPFRLQFDDPSWQQYMGSLKPLGLAILLNTCNPSTQERYAQFCSHLSCLSKFHEDFVPVTNRREWDEGRGHLSMFDCSRSSIATNNLLLTHGCLCELAKQIGFQSTARNVFSLKDQLFIFRHQADPSSRKDRLARSLSLPKLKFPFPNMVGVCVQESHTGRFQLLTQGTGEILLDACVDYWNGVDLCPLTLADRKRILDFYNRSSLTAYCTAFSYRPVDTRYQETTVCGGPESLFQTSGVYLELPTDSSHLYHPQRSPTPEGPVSLSRIQSDSNLYCGTATGGYFSRSNDSSMDESPNEPSPNSPEGVFQLQCNQTFVGMVTMQYQARTDMVQLIEQLDKASVRFVHFSKENELRSRVFSEKMGLESGWNCHISLLSEHDVESKEDGEELTNRRTNKSSMSLLNREEYTALNAATRNVHCLSISAPSAINVEMTQVKFEDEIFLHSLTDDDSRSDNSDTDLLKDEDRDRLFHSQKSPVSVKTPSPQCHHLVNCSNDGSSPSLDRCRSASRSSSSSSSSSSTCSSSSSSSSLLNVTGGGGSCWDLNLSRSQSHVTESTEQSAPVAFDLTNRAKLPRGIEEIRPHIENVDNVPLLVSLFTESTPTATREMIKIMQEYGEVVCIVGSSASAYNCALFMQADASLAVEPLYPQVCQQVPVVSPVSQTNVLSPAELSRRLNSLPCALSFHRDELSSLLHLVLESRHVGFCLRNVLQLWAASIASLSTVQLIAALFFLPPIFTTGQVLWLSCIIIPLLSISLMGAPTDPDVMNIATGKNSRKIDKGTFKFVLWSYGLKFLPSMIILLIFYGASLLSLCSYVNSDCQMVSKCLWVYPSQNGTVLKGLWSGWGEPAHEHLLYTVQHTTALAFVIFLVFISLSFVHRQYHFWQVNPFSNRLWIACCGVVSILQIIFFSMGIWSIDAHSLKDGPCNSSSPVSGFPLPAWLLLSWPTLLIPFNELVKHYEIKVNVRLQKRARLEFGTKLGMNSPF